MSRMLCFLVLNHQNRCQYLAQGDPFEPGGAGFSMKSPFGLKQFGIRRTNRGQGITVLISEALLFQPARSHLPDHLRSREKSGKNHA